LDHSFVWSRTDVRSRRLTHNPPWSTKKSLRQVSSLGLFSWLCVVAVALIGHLQMYAPSHCSRSALIQEKNS